MFFEEQNKQTKQKETKQNKNNKVKRLVMRDSPCEDVLDSPATAPKIRLMAQCTAPRKMLDGGVDVELVGNPKRKV